MLELEDVYNYCGGESCRSFFEGSAIAKSGFIIECRIKKKDSSFIEIFALCLQHSNLDGKPHEISITLKAAVSIKSCDTNFKSNLSFVTINIKIDSQVKVTQEGAPKNGYEVENATCTCKAGSHKCKHISGVLVKLER